MRLGFQVGPLLVGLFVSAGCNLTPVEPDIIPPYVVNHTFGEVRGVQGATASATVTFNEAVTIPDSAIRISPASVNASVSGSGVGPYTFEFSGLESGWHVAVELGREIVDGAGNNLVSETLVFSTAGNLATSSTYRLISPGADEISAAAITPAGVAVLAGNFRGQLFGLTGAAGDLDVQSAGQRDGLVAAVDPDLNLIWFVSLAGTLDEDITAAAATADGGVIIAGRTTSTLTIETTDIGTEGTLTLFLIRLDAGSGALNWAREITTTGAASINDMVVTPDGAIRAIGTHEAPINFGSANLGQAGRGENAFIVDFDSNGLVDQQRSYGSAGNQSQRGLSIAGTPASGTYSLIQYSAIIDEHGVSQSALGEEDVVVVARSATGDTLWSFGFGGQGPDGPGAIAALGDTHVGVAVTVRPPASGEGAVRLAADTYDFLGGSDIFVAGFTSTGGVAHAQLLGSPFDDAVAVATAISAEQWLFAGEVGGRLDFGRGPVGDDLEETTFWHVLDVEGTSGWSASLPRGDIDQAWTAADWNGGDVILAAEQRDYAGSGSLDWQGIRLSATP